MREYHNDTDIIKSFKRICKQQLAVDCTTINPDLKMSQIKTLSAFNGCDCLTLKELARNSGVSVARMAAKAIYAHLNTKDRVILLNSLDTACRIPEKIARR